VALSIQDGIEIDLLKEPDKTIFCDANRLPEFLFAHLEKDQQIVFISIPAWQALA
jgi:hypothetical protein